MEGDAVNTCPMETPSVGDCVEPAVAYPHTEQPASGQGSVTGGVFSNHCSWPAPYNGLYWFGDYNKSRVWAVTPNANRDGVDGERTIIVRQASGPVHFTAAPDGTILYTTINDGEIWRIAPTTPAPCPDTDAGLPDAMDTPDADPGMDAMDPIDATPGMDVIIGDEAGVDPDSGLDKDAGNTGNDAAPGSDTGTGGDEEDDCDCTATRSSGGASGMWIVIGLVALRTWRRRRDR
jgi:MYXO-CTERM domain-containing protein